LIRAQVAKSALEFSYSMFIKGVTSKNNYYAKKKINYRKVQKVWPNKKLVKRGGGFKKIMPISTKILKKNSILLNEFRHRRHKNVKNRKPAILKLKFSKMAAIKHTVKIKGWSNFMLYRHKLNKTISARLNSNLVVRKVADALLKKQKEIAILPRVNWREQKRQAFAKYISDYKK